VAGLFAEEQVPVEGVGPAPLPVGKVPVDQRGGDVVEAAGVAVDGDPPIG